MEQDRYTLSWRAVWVRFAHSGFSRCVLGLGQNGSAEEASGRVVCKLRTLNHLQTSEDDRCQGFNMRGRGDILWCHFQFKLDDLHLKLDTCRSKMDILLTKSDICMYVKFKQTLFNEVRIIFFQTKFGPTPMAPCQTFLTTSTTPERYRNGQVVFSHTRYV